MLQNEYSVAKIGLDTAENEPIVERDETQELARRQKKKRDFLDHL